MQQATAFCPASISFIFKVIFAQDLTRMGSLGVGCTVDKGVTVKARRRSYPQILFNQVKIPFPTVASVIKALAPQPVEIEISATLPLGCGFGISGASALACAFAINKLFSLGKDNLELATIAHIADILNYTGLGSVGTQFTGGFLQKTAPGLPVQAKSFSFSGQKIYALILDKLETPSILKDKKKIQKINKAADRTLKKMERYNISTLDDVLDLAYVFSLDSSLLQDKKMTNIIEFIKKSGGHATMNMLGKVVLSTKKPDMFKDYSWETLTISNLKAHSL